MARVALTFAFVILTIIVECHSTLWPCESNDDCSADGSTCTMAIALCECENITTVLSEDFKKCLTTSLFGDACEETVQCNLMPTRAHCGNGVCDCADGDTFIQGRCRKLNSLDQPCTTDLDCYFGYDRQSVTCENQICACADGYYHRSGNICRRKAIEIDDVCVVDADCDQLGADVKCISLTCQNVLKANATNTLIGSRSQALKTKKAVSIRGHNLKRMETERNPERFQRSLESPRLNSDDDTDFKSYGSSCTENSVSCFGLPHSICSNSICLCKQGYYHKSGKCFAELGEAAESTNECENTFDNVSQKCVCPSNYFYERNLRSCRKPIQYHLSCTSNSQCSPFGAAYCHPEIPRRCTCEEYSEYDELQQMCVYKQGLGAQCDRDEACPTADSVCSNSYCVCRDHYFEKEGACAAGIGATCSEDTDCISDNSACGDSEVNNKTCQCREGFIHLKGECLKEAQELDEECVDTEQCKALLGTCINNKCTCTAEQHFQYGRCEHRKGLGDVCERAGECYIQNGEENVECRNSVCQCKFDFQADTNKKTCIQIAPNKKSSSGTLVALTVTPLMVITSSFLIASDAIKRAYY